MNTLHVKSWHNREYGWRATGTVQAKHADIDITVREPREWDESTGLTYVMANGWTAGKASMRLPAIVAAKTGHRAITINYTNTGTTQSLRSNVRDVVSVIDAVSGKSRVSAMGLSMGGAVVTMALKDVGEQLETATLVAPGKYIREDLISRHEIVKRFLAESLEVRDVGRNLKNALFLGAASTANCVQRPLAVVAELTELLQGTVHEDLIEAKSMDHSPYVRFMWGQNDLLLPPFAQDESTKHLPFDERLSYLGGHAMLAYDRSLAEAIFQRDAELLAVPH